MYENEQVKSRWTQVEAAVRGELRRAGMFMLGELVALLFFVVVTLQQGSVVMVSGACVLRSGRAMLTLAAGERSG
jgi:hypothetical protein